MVPLMLYRRKQQEQSNAAMFAENSLKSKVTPIYCTSSVMFRLNLRWFLDIHCEKSAQKSVMCSVGY